MLEKIVAGAESWDGHSILDSSSHQAKKQEVGMGLISGAAPLAKGQLDDVLGKEVGASVESLPGEEFGKDFNLVRDVETPYISKRAFMAALGERLVGSPDEEGRATNEGTPIDISANFEILQPATNIHELK